MNALVMPGVTCAYVSWSRWVARCSYAAYCDGAAELDRFEEGFICECGRSTAVVWPDADMVSGVERLLMMRPNPKNRSWEPDETLIDLMTENAVHGVFAPLSAEPGTCLLSVNEGRIMTDALPAVPGRLAVDA